MGEAILMQKRKNEKINGTLNEYPVSANSTIQRGDFVNFVDDNGYRYVTKTESRPVQGVAKESGAAGDTIKVYVPNN